MDFIRTISANWGARKSDLENAALSLLNFLKKLERHNPMFNNWYKGGGNVENSLERRIELRIENLQSLLSDSQPNKESNKDFYSASLWNGNVDNSLSCSFYILIGSTSPYISNSFLLRLPMKGKIHDFYTKEKNQNALKELMINFWKPHSLIINGEEFL